MFVFSITKTDGAFLAINTFLSFSDKVDSNGLVKLCENNNILPTEIRALSIKASSLEVAWGAQFKDFPNLCSLELVADTRIKVNCSSTSESSIETVIIRASEVWFNDGAFADSNNLSEVTIFGAILNGWHNGLAECLFQNCKNLKTIKGFYSGENLMPCVFNGCDALEKPLDFRVKHLGWRTFSNCFSLKTIHLHNGLISMGFEAFQNCRSLQDVYIPDTVVDLGKNTFRGCDHLLSVHLPKHITVIPEGFLSDCTLIKKVFLSDEIKSIEKDAFKNCVSLSKPWIPCELVSIGERAFYGCSSIKSIYLPESVTSIGIDAFAHIPNFAIHGKKDSYAEKYASENAIMFIAE